MDETELNFKIIVIGEPGVGKTSFVNRYVEGTFSTKYKLTIGGMNDKNSNYNSGY